SDDQRRQYHRQIAVSVVEKIQPQSPANDSVGVVKKPAEHLLEVVALFAFSAIERNRFGVFTDPHEAETEIGLAPALQEVQGNQPFAENAEGDSCQQARINEEGHNQVARNGPQDLAERQHLKQSVGKHQDEDKRLLRE